MILYPDCQGVLLVSVWLFVVFGLVQHTAAFHLRIPTRPPVNQNYFASRDIALMRVNGFKRVSQLHRGSLHRLGASTPSRALSVLAKSGFHSTSSALHATRKTYTDQRSLSSDTIPIPVPDPVVNADSPKKWRRGGNSQLSNFIKTKQVDTAPVTRTDDAQTDIELDEEAQVTMWGKEAYQGKEPLHPYGDNRDLRIRPVSKVAEMELTFLGTASCIPGFTRGVTSVAHRFNSEVWLFDCGEGTQLQLKRSKVRPGRIKKIFITHTHGDHCFGLAGVLCMIGQGVMQERDRLKSEGLDESGVEPLEIYGPEGIRNYVRSIMQLTQSRVTVPHRIHELKNVPHLHTNSDLQMPNVITQMNPYYGERPGGRDIFPNADGVYDLVANENGMNVQAAPLQHTIPCVGYVITENERPGALNMSAVFGHIQRNKNALKEQYKNADRDPMTMYQDLKNLKPDEVFTFPDGTAVSGKDIVSPPDRGRKIVFMGDTCNGERIAPLAQDCDILIHEATNAYFPEDPSQRHLSYPLVEQETRSHGHSTPEMAARFAAAVNAKQLVLSHFSPRYPGDANLFSMQVMWRIEDMARRAWTEAREREREAVAAQRVDQDGQPGELSQQQQQGQLKPTHSSTGTSAGHSRQSAKKNTAVAKAPQLGKNAVIAAWDFMTLQVDRNSADKRTSKGKQPHVSIR